MEKIIIVTDSRVDLATLDFGCYLAELTKSRLIGMLLNNPVIKLTPSESYKQWYLKNGVSTETEDVVMDIDQATLYFMEECRKRGIKSEVFSDKGSPFEEVIYESRFADLLVLAPDLSFAGDLHDLPSSFVRRVLSQSECPVVLAPDTFDRVEEIVFCYDGSESSLFAIKQFTYLFPQFKNLKTSVLEIRDSDFSNKDEGHTKTLSWLRAHYDKVDFKFLQGDVKDELLIYFLNRSDYFIVMGAFGRNMLSNLFRKSSSEILIKTIDLPLFIAHH